MADDNTPRGADDDAYIIEDTGESVEEIEREMRETAAEAASDPTAASGESASPSLVAENQQLKDRVLRTLADFENFRRRAREGGSWLVRISLAQTGRWLVGRGQVPEAELKDVPKEFTSEELKRWSMTSATPMGRLHHLGPVMRLSDIEPFFAPRSANAFHRSGASDSSMRMLAPKVRRNS